MHLSKSDFKVARTCGTKLYFKKLRYPSINDDNAYMEFLADGGYMVEAIAKLLYPNGREIGFDEGSQQAFQSTMEAMKGTSVELFEATYIHGQLLARSDIVIKEGDVIKLIEVKAKSFDSVEDGLNPTRGKKGGILSDWREYLEDVAFQAHIIRCLFPDSKVIPHLCLVDKSKTCSVETSFEQFDMTPRDNGGNQKFSRPEVRFLGDIDALRQDHFLAIIDVTREVEEIMLAVRGAAAEFVATLTGEAPLKITPKLIPSCKKCEYKIADGEKNGFRECWGALAEPSPHLLDLYRVDLLGLKGAVAIEMIEQGECSLLDVRDDDLRGKIAERQKIQLRAARSGREFVGAGLRDDLERCPYPLHFVDFEGSRTAVPYHLGMRPYEQAAFQWSCHTLAAPGAELTHKEWINVENAFPNFEFARALSDAIGTEGTVFVWSHYERSALKEIRAQMIKYAEQDIELAAWLDSMIADTGPIVDLLVLAKDYYCHPQMLGSLSIKKVLPAVWNESEAIRRHPWFNAYHRIEGSRLLEPYETLDPLRFEDEEEEAEAVKEGTAAIRTYQAMMYGLESKDEAVRERYRKLLLNYCKLDTAAMVMIWMHWCQKLGVPH